MKNLNMLSASLSRLSAQLPSLQQIEQEEARRSLLKFIQFTKQPPGYFADPFHVELCGIIERFYCDVVAQKRPRVLVIAPPQHGKSQILSRHGPAWAFGKWPWLKIIATAYNSDWANAFCRDVQRLMDSEEYHQVFPGSIIPGNFANRNVAKRQTDFFELIGTGGAYKAAGRGHGITGNPAHCVLLDDPIKSAEEAFSKTTRESTWNWYQRDLYTRLQQGGGVLATLTRWHLDDWAGRVLEAEKQGGDKWEVHVFPALIEEPD